MDTIRRGTVANRRMSGFPFEAPKAAPDQFPAPLIGEVGSDDLFNVASADQVEADFVFRVPDSNCSQAAGELIGHSMFPFLMDIHGAVESNDDGQRPRTGLFSACRMRNDHWALSLQGQQI